MRWELTFLPFLFQLTLGLGSPVAWHTNETTPPETPIWSTGTLVNRGETVGRTDKEDYIKTGGEACASAAVHSRASRRESEGPPCCPDPVPAECTHLRFIYWTCYFYLSGKPLNHWDYWGGPHAVVFVIHRAKIPLSQACSLFYHLQIRLQTKGMSKTCFLE